jgi:hypothetical protein
MKTLTSTLLAAQRSASATPYIQTVFADYDGYARRARFTQYYAGSEDVWFHAACIAGDGSLLRARVQTTGTDTLYASRIASPGPASSFDGWSALDTDVSDIAGVALTSLGDDAWLLYVASDDMTLRVRHSGNNGATWGSATTVAAASSPVTHVAAAAADDGNILLLWNEGATVYRSRFNGSSWGTRTAWTHTAGSITGLACAYLLDWQVVVCGTEDTTQDPKAWTLRYGDGVNQAADTWSGLREVTGAAAGSGVSFSAPSLTFEASWRLFFVETYSGDEAYTRLQWTTMDLLHDFNEEQWREPVAFDYDGEAGASAAFGGGRLWLCSAERVWSSLLPAFEELDVSQNVFEASAEVDAHGTRVELVLDASTGLAQAFGQGTLGIIQRGARLRLTPGYETGAGLEATQPDTYWVESVELHTGPQPRLVVHARDAWWLLERWRARRQFVWGAGDRVVSQLLLFLLARAGLEYASISSSDALTSLSPAFTVHAGESGATAVRRLLSTVEDVAFWRGAELTSLLTADDDASTYAIGAAHAVTQGRYRDTGPALNRVRVVGLGVYGEATDFAESEAAGERIAQVIDFNLADAGDAIVRAVAILRKAHVEARADELRLFGVHCGVELYDVVAVTDAQAGLDAAPRRVLGYAWRYEPSRGHYDMTLTLGNV